MAVEVKELRHPGTDEVEGFVFKCTTAGLVFGPVMEFPSADDAEACLQWILKEHGDPRTLAPDDVSKHYIDFKACQCGGCGGHMGHYGDWCMVCNWSTYDEAIQ